MFDGLFDAVDGILGEEFQFIEGFFILERAIGIKAQFYLMEGEAVADTTDEVELLFEVDGTDLEFHTTEAFLQFFFEALEHLIVTAHPHESVDGNTFFAPTEGGVEEKWEVLRRAKRQSRAKS